MPAALRLLALSVTLVSPAAVSLSAVASEESDLCTLRGRVIDFFDGTGIPAAWLEIVHPTEGELEPRTTDAEGFFRVDLPVSEQEVSVSVSKTGYSQGSEIPKVVADRSEVELQVELFPRQTLEASHRVRLIEGLSLRAREQGTSLEEEIQALAGLGVEEAKIADILASVHREEIAPESQLRSPSSSRPLIAVLEFEDQAAARSGWWSYGGALALQDAFAAELVKSGKFHVLEREQLDAVLSEKGFVLSGEVDPSTAVKAGTALGVDYLLTGQVTEYWTAHAPTDGSGPSDLPGVRPSMTSFVAALNARLLDTRTGEIVWGQGARAEDSTVRFRVDGSGLGGGGVIEEAHLFFGVMEPLVQELASAIAAADI